MERALDAIVVAGILCIVLFTGVLFLALSRTTAAMRDRKLTRAGVSPTNPFHLYLRHVIQTEDRMGVMFTIAAIICSAILAFLIANQILQTFLRKLVEIFSVR